MTKRRYNDTEVAAILERATVRQESGSKVTSRGDGLTLAQLQDIGRDVGIAPQVIAESAQLVDLHGPAVTRRFLGLPIGVQRTVQLPRRLSDEEWERLVVELREIFDARGVVRSEGSLRQWTNGNLQALLELTDRGQRVRLRTFKGSALSTMAVGGSMFGVAAASITLTVLQGGAGDTGAVTAMALMAAAGASMLAGSALRLFPWAKRRHEQMAEVAARVAALDRSPAEDDSSGE